jgi:hypothetical protein
MKDKQKGDDAGAAEKLLGLGNMVASICTSEYRYSLYSNKRYACAGKTLISCPC